MIKNKTTRCCRPGLVGNRALPKVTLRAMTWPSMRTIWTNLSSRANEGAAVPGATSWTRAGTWGVSTSAAASASARARIAPSMI